MAVRSKTGTNKIEIVSKRKKTRQGNGQNSKPHGTRKLLRGQGK